MTFLWIKILFSACIRNLCPLLNISELWAHSLGSVYLIVWSPSRKAERALQERMCRRKSCLRNQASEHVGAAGCSLRSGHCKKGKEPSITPASLVFSWLPWVGGGGGVSQLKKRKRKIKNFKVGKTSMPVSRFSSWHQPTEQIYLQLHE